MVPKIETEGKSLNGLRKCRQKEKRQRTERKTLFCRSRKRRWPVTEAGFTPTSNR